MTDPIHQLGHIGAFAVAAAEQSRVLDEFYTLAERQMSGTDAPMAEPDPSVFELRRNFFSSLFMAAYAGIGIERPRRMLYGFVNQCLRTLVTGCDNLLDDEYKEVIPFQCGERGERFKSVLALLAGDRVLFARLRQEERAGHLTPAEADTIIDVSLAALVPSGLEEAGEEGGVDRVLPPDEVLEEIHRVKTGLLFEATLAAPLALGDVSPADAARVGRALSDFGLGCQLLDDLVDLDLDRRELRHNYALSLVRFEGAPAEKLLLDDREPVSRQQLPSVQHRVSRMACERFRCSLGVLGPMMGMDDDDCSAVIDTAFTLLGVCDILDDRPCKAGWLSAVSAATEA